MELGVWCSTVVNRIFFFWDNGEWEANNGGQDHRLGHSVDRQSEILISGPRVEFDYICG